MTSIISNLTASQIKNLATATIQTLNTEDVAALTSDKVAALSSVAGKFSLVVRKLQAEMKIISRLADESQRLGDLMLSEWRRMESAFSPSNGFDLKG